jgi:hypothetical protein
MGNAALILQGYRAGFPYPRNDSWAHQHRFLRVAFLISPNGSLSRATGAFLTPIPCFQALPQF